MKKSALYIAFSLVLISILYVAYAATPEKWRVYISKNINIAESLYLKAKNYALNENRKPKGPYADAIVLTENPIIAFSDKLAYNVGEVVELLIKSKDDVTVTIYNAEKDRRVISQNFVPFSNRRNLFTYYTKSNGFDLKEFNNIAFKTGDWKTGWHSIEVKSEKFSLEIPILVRSINENKILFVESTDTLKAYRSSGDLPTFYRNLDGTGYHWRPNKFPLNYKIRNTSEKFEDCYDHLINADMRLKYLVNGVYKHYDVVEDEYLDVFENIRSYELIIFGAHNEYWSPEKFLNLKSFVEKGGSLLFLGGNTAWRYVLRVSEGDVIDGGGAFLSEHDWIYGLIGSRYSRVGYNTYAGYKNLNPAHFLMSGVGDVFGSNSVIEGCEGFAASGRETDKLSGEDFTILAQGMNGRGKGADLVFRKKSNSSGSILNFGSVTLYHSYKDENLRKILENYREYLGLN